MVVLVWVLEMGLGSLVGGKQVSEQVLVEDSKLKVQLVQEVGEEHGQGRVVELDLMLVVVLVLVLLLEKGSVVPGKLEAQLGLEVE